MKKETISKICRLLALILTLASVIYGAVTMVNLRQDITRKDRITLDENGIYNSKEDIADYVYKYRHLPDNYMTKSEAQLYGWIGGNPESVQEKAAIGGDRFFVEGETILPMAAGRYYTECDVNSWGLDDRNSERILFSNDGVVLYTNDHYSSFEVIYQ